MFDTQKLISVIHSSLRQLLQRWWQCESVSSYMTNLRYKENCTWTSDISMEIC